MASAGAVRDEFQRVLLDPAQAAALEVHGRTKAGVLVPLYMDNGELHAVFTKRRDDLRRHPGEISFPGGRADVGEDDLRITALREAEEEIGLARERVDLVGALQPTPTIATGYAVYPFVGLIEAQQRWRLSAREVAAVIELPLQTLRRGYARQRLIRRGLPIRTDTYSAGGHLIWGATARILADLFDRIGPLLADISPGAIGELDELQSSPPSADQLQFEPGD
jgi:8-oxo-dGTP pyrophosphatase MutT (NUDIX family)